MVKRIRNGGQLAEARQTKRSLSAMNGPAVKHPAVKQVVKLLPIAAAAQQIQMGGSAPQPPKVPSEAQSERSIGFEMVTPARARLWLEHFNEGNRTIKQNKIAMYIEDMKAGRWTNCEGPISFYTDGKLANGQHRLNAIVFSETSHEFPIYRGLDRADGLNIDTGVARDIIDNGRISGRDTDLTYALVAACGAIHSGRSSPRGGRGATASMAGKIEIVERYREAGEWAIHNGPRVRGLANACVHAAMARAWYYYSTPEDLERLKRFGTVVNNSALSAGEHESAAVIIRNHLLSDKAAISNSTRWPETFRKIQHAIKAFMEGRKLLMLKAIQEDTYPLDGRRMRKR